VNELCWVSLQVQDVEQARFFWRDVVGLPERSAAPNWVELELRPGLLLALHPVFHPPAIERQGYDRGGAVLGIRVRDLEAMAQLIERHGGKALGAAHPIPGGRARDFICTDGYLFELVELSEPR
jgi:predicted enzyme related to lactoylglutathione lyase